MTKRRQTKKIETKKTLKELMKEKRKLNKYFKSIEVTMYLHDKVKSTDKNFDKLADDEVNFYNLLTDLEKIEHNRLRLGVLGNELAFVKSQIDLRNFEHLRNFTKNSELFLYKNLDDEIKLINQINDLRKKQTEIYSRVILKPLLKIQKQINEVKKESSINV